MIYLFQKIFISSGGRRHSVDYQLSKVEQLEVAKCKVNEGSVAKGQQKERQNHFCFVQLFNLIWGC